MNRQVIIAGMQVLGFVFADMIYVVEHQIDPVCCGEIEIPRRPVFCAAVARWLCGMDINILKIG